MLLVNWKYYFARFILLLLPTTGYIHPDEFFQSVEAVAGDVLNLKVHRPWEFAPETVGNQRIRNIAIPYMTVGFPLMILKNLSDLSVYLFNISLLSSYTVLVASRISYTLLSLTIDFCLYRTCLRNGKRYDICLLLFGSSYVTLIYLGHSLSNSIETVLFAVYIDTISECIHRRSRNKPKNKNVKSEKVHFISNSTKISIILTLGIFNRPTFVLYAFIPTLFWVVNGKVSLQKFEEYFRRCVSLLPASLALGLILVITDTIYYDPNFITKLVSASVSVKDLIATPLNFILYNLDPNNLASHGLHPRFTHLLVNQPLLFGPLSFIFIVTVLQSFSSQHKKSSASSDDLLIKSTAIASILLMSVFSHQEPRFLTGLIFPLIYLYAERITSSAFLSKVWIIFNIICCIFYGFLHQGGVVSSLNFVRNYSHNLQQNLDVVYYHTYMPPRFLLLNEQTDNYEVKIHDLMGDSTIKLQQTLNRFENALLVIPSSLRENIQQSLHKNFQLDLIANFKLHLSMEDPPPLTKQFLYFIGMDIYNVTKFVPV